MGYGRSESQTEDGETNQRSATTESTTPKPGGTKERGGVSRTQKPGPFSRS